MYKIGFVCQDEAQADRLRKVVNRFFEIEEITSDGVGMNAKSKM